MRLSRNAEGLIADLAKEQGLQKLEFDADGLIAIRLDGQTHIAIGYSPNNDALILSGVIDPAPDRATLDCWDILKRNASLAEYKIPGFHDLPRAMTNEMVDAEQTTGPFGAKGVGETSTFGVSPAIANAIQDAIGVRLTSLPMNPESVWQAMQEKK